MYIYCDTFNILYIIAQSNYNYGTCILGKIKLDSVFQERTNLNIGIVGKHDDILCVILVIKKSPLYNRHR